MKTIVIYAEKPDVAYKISVAFKGVSVTFKGKSVTVTMNDYEKYKPGIEAKYSKQGYVDFIHNGEQYYVTWGYGHMCSLKQAYDYNSEYANWSKIPKPFFPDDYEIKIREGYNRKTRKSLKVDPIAKKQLSVVKNLFSKCDMIINATDDDREGELIFSYVYEYTKSSKPYKRVFLDSYTEEGILKSFSNLKDSSDVKLVEMAGRARSIADWVVGANLTVAFTTGYSNALSKTKKPEVFSVGRVQTATLNILCQREKEILNFKPSTSYYLEGEFTTKDGKASSYLGSANKTEYKTEDEAKEVLKNLQNLEGDVIIYERKDNYKDAPLLYNLSSLSIDANREYSMTAKQTLDTASSLYLKGYLTYPRTSSSYLPDDMKDSMHEVLDLLEKTTEFGSFVKMVPKPKRRMTKRHFDSSKVESHYAIVPTNKLPNLTKLSDYEKNIYTLVAHSVIKSVFPPAKIQSTKIETKVGDEIFYTSGNVILEKNWLNVKSGTSVDEELPILSVGDKVDSNLKISSKTTRAPNRFTDSSLVLAMLSAGKTIEDKDLRKALSENTEGGIGTEATRAGIIETVISRGYASRKGKYILPTERGMDVIKLLPIDDLKSPVLTAKWESRLNDIQKGEDSIANFVSDLEKQTDLWVKEVLKTSMSNPKRKNYEPQSTGVNCPNCGADIIENDYGFFCSENDRNDFSSCQFKLFKSSDKFKFSPNTSVDDLKSIVETGQTGIKNAISKKGSKYQFVYKLNDDNQSLEFTFPENQKGATKIQETDFNCPVCGNALTHVKNEEKKWDFYSCKGHVIVGADYFGTPLSHENIRDLLEGETIGPMTMQGKNGEYEAYLHLDMSEGKIKRVD